MQKRFFHCLIMTLIVVALAPVKSGLGAQSTDTIKFALPGNSMGYLPLFVAVHRGFFKDEGLDIELPRLIPAMAQNALLAGEVHYHGLADSGLRLAARGLPLKAIFYGADRPMYYLVAQKDIHSVAELRGKRVGVSQFGGTSDLSARLALRHYGIEPEKDAILIQIGAEGVRMAALRAGSVSAIIVPVPAVAVLRREGYNEVSFVGDVVEFASNGYTTTEQRIKENPQEVKKVVRAIYRGLRYAKENPEGTIGVIQKNGKSIPRSPRAPTKPSSKLSTRTASSVKNSSRSTSISSGKRIKTSAKFRSKKSSIFVCSGKCGVNSAASEGQADSACDRAFA
jgi:NitT/TauT family transport system substrate-binding protein